MIDFEGAHGWSQPPSHLKSHLKHPLFEKLPPTSQNKDGALFSSMASLLHVSECSIFYSSQDAI